MMFGESQNCMFYDKKVNIFLLIKTDTKTTTTVKFVTLSYIAISIRIPRLLRKIETYTIYKKFFNSILYRTSS